MSTLHNLLHYLKLFDLQRSLFVLDRGFYSATNLRHMAQSQLRFLLPLPRSVKAFTTLRAKHYRRLTHPAKAFLFNEQVLFHCQDATVLNQLPLQAHLYFDPQRRCDQTAHFLKRLLEVETAAQGQTFENRTDVLQYLDRHFPGATQVFRVSGTTSPFTITRKPTPIAQRMANMGVAVLLTNEPGLARERILELYRRKDYLEKAFDTLKNEFDGKRLRASTKDTLEGRLFLKFLSLILYSAVASVMRDRDLFKRYSMREMMTELKKLRRVEMNNGRCHLTEISKRQKNIFKKFDVPIPGI